MAKKNQEILGEDKQLNSTQKTKDSLKKNLLLV